MNQDNATAPLNVRVIHPAARETGPVMPRPGATPRGVVSELDTYLAPAMRILPHAAGAVDGQAGAGQARRPLLPQPSARALSEGLCRRAVALCQVVPASLASGAASALFASVAVGSFVVVVGSAAVFAVTASAGVLILPAIPLALCALGLIGLFYPIVYMAPVVALLTGVAAIMAPVQALVTGRGLEACEAAREA